VRELSHNPLRTIVLPKLSSRPPGTQVCKIVRISINNVWDHAFTRTLSLTTGRDPHKMHVAYRWCRKLAISRFLSPRTVHLGAYVLPHFPVA
jgi:hypothetical protein